MCEETWLSLWVAVCDDGSPPLLEVSSSFIVLSFFSFLKCIEVFNERRSPMLDVNRHLHCPYPEVRVHKTEVTPSHYIGILDAIRLETYNFVHLNSLGDINPIPRQ